ncbi:MAG: DUF4442 domain-containing protein [Chitinophagaceae bacterium]|nr:DUF4442 domain-containing protein [Chitinophagaceae bacterium]
MSQSAATFIRQMKHPLKFRLFLFFRLPAAFFAGVRMREMDEAHCVVSVPYKWLSQNPFRSTYFACLAMAAEMSTGALAMAHLYHSDPPVSMLVVKLESEYFKKAVGRTYFHCEDGDTFKNTIEQCIRTGEAGKVEAHSVGKDKDGEIIARFTITWSFKARRSPAKA